MAEKEWEAYVDAVAPAVGLVIRPEWRPGVVRFLGLAAEMAATLERAGLSADHLDVDAVLRLPEGGQ